jgi:hypothetical protein
MDLTSFNFNLINDHYLAIFAIIVWATLLYRPFIVVSTFSVSALQQLSMSFLTAKDISLRI